MKLHCNVIEDMLPMYFDGVCSEESAELVEAHLKDCPQCSKMLSDLQSAIDVQGTAVDDLKPLSEIEKKWKNSKKIYIGRGVCIALATLLIVTAVVSGIWYFSYAKYYHQLSRGMKRISGEEVAMTSADYTFEQDGFRFDVNMPSFLSNSAFARVMNDDGLVLFLYPKVGGEYTFWLYITDSNNRAYSVYLKSNMTADFENHQFPARSEKEQEHIQQVLTEREDDIVAMLNAIYALWGIDLLEYAPY